MSEPLGVDLGLLPLERRGGWVVRFDEGIDGLAQLLDRGEAGAVERAAGEDREPDLDLVEPAGVGRGEVEVDTGMAGQPSIPFGLVGAEIVEDDVDLAIGVIGDHVVHEVEELDAPPALGVLGLDLAGGDVEGGEERGGATPLVLVGEARERPTAGQLEVTLRPFQRLDRRLLVDRAIARLPRPPAARSTIRARSAKRCSVVGARAHASSAARSSADTTIGVASWIAMPNH